MAKQSKDCNGINNTQLSQNTTIFLTSPENNENSKDKTLLQDKEEINNILSHNNTILQNESSESSEDEEYETPSKEPYENKYIKLTTIDALDFFPTSDESDAICADGVLSIIHKASNLTFLFCLVSSIFAAFFSQLGNSSGLWLITRLYVLSALFWVYHLYRLNSSPLLLKDTISAARKIAIGIAVIQSIYQLFIRVTSKAEADLVNRNPLLYAGSVISVPFLIFLEGVLNAYQRENFRKQALLEEERKNSQSSVYRAIDRFGERKGLYLRTISNQLRQTIDMAVDTLKQLSPPHFLSKPREQLSACSISFPTASINAINVILKDINYISTHLGTLSLLLFSEQNNKETSNVRREFDIGEIIQHVGDVLAGYACNANVEFVIYHVEYGLNHLNVIGDEAAFRHSLLDLLKCIIDGASPGDCVELGLGLQVRSSGESESEKEHTINPHDKVTCTVEIIHNAEVIGSKKESNRNIFPNANLTHKILNFLGASLKVDEEQGSQRLEITIELEAGSTLTPPNVPDINEESRRRYPHLRTTGEPSIEELNKTSQSMRGQRVALHATSKSYFAKHITSCLTTWGTDISHVPIGGEDESSETAPTSDSEEQSSEEHKNDELQQPLNANIPPTFIIIDDDIDTLKQQISQLRKAPFQLKAVRQKREGQAPTSSSQTTAVIHFTSLANYKSVKDFVQYNILPTTGSFSLPQILVIPKPAGPRRFLTALHTTINKIVVDPVYMPLATSPISPGQQSSIGGYSIDPNANPLDSSKFTESPGNYFPPDAASMFRPGTPSATNSPMSPKSGSGLLVIPKQTKQRNPDVNRGSSPGNNGPLSPKISSNNGCNPIGTSTIQPSTPPPPSPSVSNQSTQPTRIVKTPKPKKEKPKTDTVIPPVNVLIVEDNPINQAILSTFMKKKKIKYECASNGQEAVDKWQKGGFHMVLMDIQLPVMDGIEATKKIRSLEKSQKIGVLPSTPPTASSSASTSASSSVSSTPNSTPMQQTPPSLGLPVIILALTASSLSSDRQNALAAGCNDFLTKPVSLVWLEKKIQEWGCMQALIDFDGWKKYGYELEAKKKKRAESIASPSGKKSNSNESSDKLSKNLKQPQDYDTDNKTTKSSIKTTTSRSTLPPINNNIEINTSRRSSSSPASSPATTPASTPTFLRTPSGGIKILPAGVVSSGQHTPPPPSIVIKPSTPQSNKESIIDTESNKTNNISPKVCPISAANNMKNNLISNNPLTITTNTSTPSTDNTANTTNESTSQPSTPLSTSAPVRKRGNTVSSVTDGNSG